MDAKGRVKARLLSGLGHRMSWLSSPRAASPSYKGFAHCIGEDCDRHCTEPFFPTEMLCNIVLFLEALVFQWCFLAELEGLLVVGVKAGGW